MKFETATRREAPEDENRRLKELVADLARDDTRPSWPWTKSAKA